MTAEGNDPLTKMAISATQLTLFFAIFLRYFSRRHWTNSSQIPQDLSLSYDLVGFAIFAIPTGDAFASPQKRLPLGVFADVIESSISAPTGRPSKLSPMGR